MATRKVKLTGIAEWARVFESNRDMDGFDGVYRDHDGACTIDLIMDDDNLAALKASRSMKRGTADAEGRGTKVKFIRKFNTGKDWDSGAPIVQKSDGSTWDISSDGTIGNGSTVEVLLSVYDTKMKSIVDTRLDAVTVLDHVQYVRDTAGDASPPTAAKQEGEVLF